MISRLLPFGKQFARTYLSLARSLYIHMQALGMLRGFTVWLQSELFGSRFDVTLSAPGSPVPITLRAGTSDIEVYKKIFVEHEYNLPFDAHPSTIIDLGANTGLASLFFLSRFPTVSILAVEPDPNNFAMLKRHLGGLSNVTCLQAAVWTHDGHVDLVDPGIGSWGMQVTDTLHTEPTKNTVAAISIETLLTKLPSGRADLLKVDIEGAEKELFSGNPLWISKVGAIVIELHDRFKPGCSRAFFTSVDSFTHEQWIGENTFVWRS
jgi:FkbM family methyltransferase